MSAATSSPEVTSVAVTAPVSRGRLIGLPVIADLVALVRFFRDGEASLAGKVFLVAAVAYIVWPLDAVPDVAPLLGWLDDLGVAALALAYVMKVARRYKSE